MFLGGVYLWKENDAIVSDQAEEPTLPAANLKTFQTAVPWRDTDAGANGFTWHFDGANVDSFCVEVGNVKTDPAADKEVFMALATGSPWSTINKFLVADSFKLNPNSIYSTSYWQPEGLRWNVLFGVDSFDTDPTVHDGFPKALAHGSGRFRWRDADPMPDGYHQASYLAFGIEPFVVPEPEIRLEPLKLRVGRGWSYSLSWSALPIEDPEPSAPDAGTKGSRQLMQFFQANAELPIFCFPDTRFGKDATGVMSHPSMTPELRGGLMRIVRYDARLNEGVARYDMNATLETWQETSDART